MDLKGYMVDYKGYKADLKGYIVDLKGYTVDLKGYIGIVGSSCADIGKGALNTPVTSRRSLLSSPRLLSGLAAKESDTRPLFSVSAEPDQSRPRVNGIFLNPTHRAP
eukprot:257594-Pyramimonas_sp.AAC.1